MTRNMVIIEFFDITTRDGWIAEDELSHQPLLCTVVGKVIHEDDTLITLASLYTQGQIGYFTILPKGCIVSRVEI